MTDDRYPEPTVDQAFILNSFWYCISKKYCIPEYSYIALGITPEDRPVAMHRLFKAMQLDLDALSSIFVRDPQIYGPLPEGIILKPTYASLHALSIENASGWSALSALTNKVIHLSYSEKAYGVNGLINVGRKINTYYPDGKIKPYSG